MNRREFLVSTGSVSTLEFGTKRLQPTFHRTDSVDPNRSILEEPVFKDETAVAHYMTNMLPNNEFQFTRLNVDPTLYDPTGPTENIAGATRYATLLSLIHGGEKENTIANISKKDAAKIEMKTAKRFGVDGFDMFYPAVPNNRGLNNVFRSFLKAAEELGTDFKLAFSIDPSVASNSTDEKIRRLVKGIREAIEGYRSSNNLLRTPDGRLIIYTFAADRLVFHEDVGPLFENPDKVEEIAEAYERIAEGIDEPVAWIFSSGSLHIQYNSEDFLERILDYFPAVIGWFSSDRDHANCDVISTIEHMANRCKKRNREFGQSAGPDFFDGPRAKPIPESGNGRYIRDISEIKDISTDDIYYRYFTNNITLKFRRRLSELSKFDADFLRITSWNDYHEFHHLAPEINHNFGYGQIAKHYIDDWKDKSTNDLSDIAIVAFPKSPTYAKASPFDVSLDVESLCHNTRSENTIEVVTILDEPGQVTVNENAYRPVDEGLQATRFPIEPGHVEVSVRRQADEIIRFTTPEAITEQPFRTDRGTFTYSSNHDKIYRDLYGENTEMYVSNQYATEELVDGPNFGKPSSYDAKQAASFDIDVTNAPRQLAIESEETVVELTVENTGELTGRRVIRLQFAAEHPYFDRLVDKNELMLDPGEARDIQLHLPRPEEIEKSFVQSRIVSGDDIVELGEIAVEQPPTTTPNTTQETPSTSPSPSPTDAHTDTLTTEHEPIENTKTDSDNIPGFGLYGGLVTLGGAGYLLNRKITSDGENED